MKKFILVLVFCLNFIYAFGNYWRIEKNINTGSKVALCLFKDKGIVFLKMEDGVYAVIVISSHQILPNTKQVKVEIDNKETFEIYVRLTREDNMDAFTAYLNENEYNKFLNGRVVKFYTPNLVGGYDVDKFSISGLKLIADELEN